MSLADARSALLLAQRAVEAALRALGPDQSEPSCTVPVATSWAGTKLCGQPAVERQWYEAWCAQHREGASETRMDKR